MSACEYVFIPAVDPEAGLQFKTWIWPDGHMKAAAAPIGTQDWRPFTAEGRAA